MQSVRSIMTTTLCALCWLVANPGLAEETNDPSFPYSAYVDEHGATILSGPDQDFYSTGRLEWGTKVEVFRHDDDYAAVRPPAGSFSWVPAEAVEATEDTGIVRVIVNDVHTRIGSTFNDDHAAEYVRLRKNELLEVLGQQELSEAAGVDRKSWFKVSPPAGEFRWIRLKSICSSPPKKAAAQATRSKPKLLAKSNEQSAMDVAEASSTTLVTTESSESLRVSAPPSNAVRQLATGLSPEPVGSAIQLASGAEPLQDSEQPIETKPRKSRESTKNPATTLGSKVDAFIQSIVGQNPNSTPTTELKPAVSHVDLIPDQTTRDEITTITEMKPSGTEDRPGSRTNIRHAAAVDVQPAAFASRIATHSEATRPAPAQWRVFDGRLLPGENASRTRSTPWREVSRFERATTDDSSRRQESSTNMTDARMATLPTLADSPLPTGSAYADTLPGELANPTPIYVGTSDKSFMQRELASINLELTTEVSQPPEFWTLNELRIRTQAVIDASQVAEIRDQAQNLLARIAQFQDVQRRGAALASRVTTADNATLLAQLPSTLPSRPNASEPTMMASRTPGVMGARIATNPRFGPQQIASVPSASQLPKYDGTGWLMPVVSSNRGVPKYVLTDDHGRVLQFVSPQPGVKLNSYVRQKIGVFGQKSFANAYDRPHLVAERIVTLNRVR